MARPAGVFNQASHSPRVLEAAKALATPERAPTRREIAAHLMLSTREIRTTVDNLTRTGRLHPVRLRKVAYRTRPVAEYAPAPEPTHDDQVIGDDSRQGEGWVDLGRCVAGWTR